MSAAYLCHGLQVEPAPPRVIVHANPGPAPGSVGTTRAERSLGRWRWRSIQDAVERNEH